MNVFKNFSVGLLASVLILLPAVSQAQVVTEDEYRSYLLQLISELQELLVLLETQQALESNDGSFEIKRDVPFESLLITGDEVDVQYLIDEVADVAKIPNRTHRAYFERFFDLVPDEYDRYFIDLLIFDEDAEEFEGFVETVPPYREDTWRLGLNEVVLDWGIRAQFTEELFVHEFAHILSYQSVTESDQPGEVACHEYFSAFGCPSTNSYFQIFMDEFWTEDDLSALVESNGEDSIWLDREIEDFFVSEYASTKPGEDFAESFTAFVLGPKPIPSDLKDDKVLFFYDYKHTRDLRKEILSQL